METDSIRDAIRARLDDLTKPKGSLGKLEDFAEKLALIQGLVPPRVRRKAVFVMAGDHGIVDQGVSLYPRAVTEQMFQTIMAGGAGINVLSRACGFDVYAVDAGVDADLPAWPMRGSAGAPGCFSMKAVRGTRDFSVGPAFTEANSKSAYKWQEAGPFCRRRRLRYRRARRHGHRQHDQRRRRSLSPMDLNPGPDNRPGHRHR